MIALPEMCITFFFFGVKLMSVVWQSNQINYLEKDRLKKKIGLMRNVIRLRQPSNECHQMRHEFQKI